MKARTLVPYILMLLLLSGCQSRQGPAPVETPTLETPQPPAVEESAEPEEPEPTFTLRCDSGDAALLQDGDETSGLLLPPGGRVSLCFDQAQPLEVLELWGDLGGEAITIWNGEDLIYNQEIEKGQRLCYLDLESCQELTIQLPQGGQLWELNPLELPENSPGLMAYLPLSAASEEVLSGGSLPLLQRLTVNIGCYWRGDGSLEVDSALPGLLQRLGQEAPGLELLCTVNPRQGGAAALQSPESRALLIENLLDLCRGQNLRGIDIDWEFPQNEAQWQDFSALLVELGQALHEENFLLTAAFYPHQVDLSPAALQALDSINVMAYDQFDEMGRHATYEGAREALERFYALGCRPEQPILGLPAYGRPLDASAQWPFYREAAAALAQGGNLWQGAWYNSPQLVADKCALARQEGLGGLFLYHLGCDLPAEEALSLCARAAEALG